LGSLGLGGAIYIGARVLTTSLLIGGTSIAITGSIMSAISSKKCGDALIKIDLLMDDATSLKQSAHNAMMRFVATSKRHKRT